MFYQRGEPFKGAMGMEINFFQRIQSGLLGKRQNLNRWLEETPLEKRRRQLGSQNEKPVRAHLDVIESAVERVEEGTLGVCEVCHDIVNPRLLEMDYTACVCLDHLSQRERQELESELEFLQTVQKALLPQQPPEIPELKLAAFSRPAQIVGGDYFDFLRFQDGAHGLVIADAMGHGVSASLLISSLQAALRALVPESVSPAAVLQRVNRIFLHNINFTTFVTALLGHYEPATRTLIYCNAGHNPPLLLNADDGQETWLGPTAAAIGLVEAYAPEAQVVTLRDGDILSFYTDGVTEASNPQGEQFGRERLARVVRQNTSLPAQDLLRVLRQALDDFSGGRPLEDDATLVICRLEAGEALTKSANPTRI
jgi:RNA polymerase-binding transcription factor DksA